ncbi:hypothetical protein CAEBREN_09827 [Caenorhabditis brenneri]|uniref:Edg1 TPR repeats region domain-containing protein n=1 Tax=Caenorhabditis brenneri TaxID=135651 RepID=G0NI65_CAEBE|nr:hypothetical protein CAEBREN_09827 [Caenorhabditis brenneri]
MVAASATRNMLQSYGKRGIYVSLAAAIASTVAFNAFYVWPRHNKYEEFFASVPPTRDTCTRARKSWPSCTRRKERLSPNTEHLINNIRSLNGISNKHLLCIIYSNVFFPNFLQLWSCSSVISDLIGYDFGFNIDLQTTMVFISPNEDGEKLPEPEELDKQKKWTQTVEQMFIGYKNYKPDRGFIDSFLMEEFDFKLYNFLGHEVIINMIQYFQAGVTQPNRVFCEDYVRIMRKIYKMLTESNKHVYQKHFINEWQHHRIDYSPYFETLIPHYADKVKDLLAAVAAKPTEVEEYVREEVLK